MNLDCDRSKIGPCAVVLGDERQELLAEGLSARQPDGGAWAKTLFLPMTPGDYAYALDSVADGGSVVCYEVSEALRDEAKRRDLNLIELAGDGEFVAENAQITAECALALIILESKKRLADGVFSILGGGRIAMALLRLLAGADAGEIRLFARSEIQRAKATQEGALAHGLDSTDALAGTDVLVNTIPHEVLFEEDLKKLPATCLLLELASVAGYDPATAQRLGLKSEKASGLPGRYAPWSASQLILKHAQIHMTEE